MFRVGQKVVCVDASIRYQNPPWNKPIPLVKGRVYTIRGSENGGGVLGVYLFETKSNLPPFPDGSERSFCADRFRPIVERKTDISIFTEMFSPVRKHEVANG